MVAAGTGAVVGITLWTVAEGRYEPQGFPSFVIANEDLTYDPIAQKSNYSDLRKVKTQTSGGRAWEIEASIPIRPADWLNEVNAVGFAPQGYEPEKDSNGTVTKTAAQVAQEDFATLFHGMPPHSARLTRMRADLAHAALDRDLPLSASADQGVLAAGRQATRWTSQPPGCPAGCSADNAPGAVVPAASPASNVVTSGPSASGSSCAIGTSDPAGWTAFALGAIAFATVRRRRR
jgi:MYXO-CTERM domain-containing protein